MPQSLNTSTYLDLSTKYITRSDNDLLEGYAACWREDEYEPDPGAQDPPFGVTRRQYGYYLTVLTDHLDDRVQQMSRDGFSEDFINLYRRCAQERIRLICLDRDGDEQPLPEHHW